MSLCIRHVLLLLLVVVFMPRAALAQLRVEVVDRAKLQLTFDPAQPAGPVRVESDHTLPVVVQADGRRQMVVPLWLRPQPAPQFDVRAGSRIAKLDITDANPLPIARTRFSDDVYLPVAGVRRDDAAFRSAVLSASVVFTCAVIGAALLRRGAVPGIVVASGLCVAGAIGWTLQQPACIERRAVVEVTGQGNVKSDVWTWLIAQRSTTIDWPNPVPARVPRVLASSRSHLQALTPELLCDAAGNVTHVRLTLQRGTQVAMVLNDATLPEGLPIDPVDLAGVSRDYYRGQRVMKREPGQWRVSAAPQ
jgi:hypothetical protein